MTDGSNIADAPDPVNGLPADVARAWAAMSGQLAEVMAQPKPPFLRKPPSGFRRGIDFYPASHLFVVMTRAAARYESVHGRYPDIVAPERFTELVYAGNYFRRLKTPETGDKLRTATFLTPDARESVLIPEVVWRSKSAKLPPPQAIAPGTYYLKTNHGSDMYERLEWPLDGGEAVRLEALFEGHLQKPYGYWNGEWWYSVIAREIFLERCVARDDHPIAWCCYTFGGKVGFVIAYRKLGEGSETIWLNPDFTPCRWQNRAKQRPRFAMPSAALRATMLEAAAKIGAPHAFVRVDFLLGDDERIYLSELTFSPGNATTPFPAELDLQLGSLWNAALAEDEVANRQARA